ncbi:hypothetical protein R1sor_000933 [Riccia sorocarpa]|uniref:CHCH domain-containing protein n=1 Tax=Riccia sorocarpa TaxID=122646 RepID=A0ABD3GW73_9MARC
MVFTGGIAYADRRHDNGKASRDSAEISGQQKDSEHKAQVEQTERLLACPCLDDLKQGPCGQKFQDAFRCFVLSKEAERGAECLHQFTQFEMCITANSEMFQKAADRKAPSLDPSIPRVPWETLNFNATPQRNGNGGKKNDH